RLLPGRLPCDAQPVPAPPRRTRFAPGAGLHPCRPLPRLADPLSSIRLFGSQAPRRRLDRRRPVGGRHHRLVRRRRLPDPVRIDADLRDAVGALSLDRERRPDLLLVRLGVAPAGSRLPHDLPGSGHDDAAVQPHRAHALASVPRRVRRRAHQDARGPVLARPDLPLLPPRDSADAQSAELVLPPPAEAPPSDGMLGNHFAQLVVPWFLFLPQPIATLAGIVIVATQSW